MAAFVRLAGSLPTMQKVLFRNLPALVATWLFLTLRHVPLRPERGNWGNMAGRAVAGTAGIVMNFYAIDHMVLADANMLNKLSPFFAILFSLFLLREKVKPAQAAGVAAAFAGALLIMRPTGGMGAVPAVCGMLGGMGAGLAYTFVRRMGSRGENGARIVFYFSLFSCLASLPYTLTAGVPMTPRQLLVMAAAGLCGLGGQVFITAAYFYAPARELSVYEYMQVLFATVWGWLLFGQVPDLLSVAGYVVIVGAAVVMFLYNNGAGPFRKKDGAPAE